MDPLVPFVKAVIIMDGEGNRLSSKYYARDEFPSEAERVGLLRQARGVLEGTCGATIAFDHDLVLLLGGS